MIMSEPTIAPMEEVDDELLDDPVWIQQSQPPLAATTGLTSHAHQSSQDAHAAQLHKRRRVTRACDECRKKKIKVSTSRHNFYGRRILCLT